MIKYPNDFRSFKGKELTIEEINTLLQEAIENSKECQPSDFSNFLYSVRTGDIRIEIYEHNIQIWQEVANHYKEA